MYRRFAQESRDTLRPDLRGWALQILLDGLPYKEKMAERDQAIRAAAAFLPDDLCVSERARRVHAEMSALVRSARPSHPDFTTMRGCLAHALLARARVPNVQQVRRILDVLP